MATRGFRSGPDDCRSRLRSGFHDTRSRATGRRATGRVLGVDASATAAAAARDGAARQGLSNVDIVTSTAEDVDLSVRARRTASSRGGCSATSRIPPRCCVMSRGRLPSGWCRGRDGLLALPGDSDRAPVAALRQRLRRRVPELRRRRRIARRGRRAAALLRGGRPVGPAHRASRRRSGGPDHRSGPGLPTFRRCTSRRSSSADI